jgi:hypothetical protein
MFYPSWINRTLKSNIEEIKLIFYLSQTREHMAYNMLFLRSTEQICPKSSEVHF